ncbi:lysine--tRNA ligase [Candidatus Wolfebacteria bacterium]|nr:lysine--tRNA ligase [Candidatus Wolfebacteria bacterium]
MFWADKIAKEIKKERGDGPLIIRDEKTMSGRVHIGSMRGVAIHGALGEALTEHGVENEYHYEINDFDPMDGLPSYLDADVYAPHMGKQLKDIPSPDGKAKNYAEYFAGEFMEVIEKSGYIPKFYRASELYLSGKMDPYIKMALEGADKIRKIYKEVSGSEKSEDWLPLNVVCEKCGKIGTTKVTSFDGEKVAYSCLKDMVKWAEGCGHEGSVSPFGGNAKLPWKPEWAAKWGAMNVSVEGAGKDHSTRGGSRDVANRIAKEVFDITPPFDVPYEFFLIGGKKMSSSKGSGSTSREISELFPMEIFRLLLIGKDINKQINFSPDGETVPVLYDQYDTIARKFEAGEEDDFARLYEYCQLPSVRSDIPKPYLTRFSHLAYMSQMPHVDVYKEIAEMKESDLVEVDKKNIEERLHYIKQWLSTYAPERYKFEIQETLPDMELSDIQKKALGVLADFVEEHKEITGQMMHERLHAIKKEVGIEPKDLFTAIYGIFLNKDSGPKGGWFLSVLDQEFLLKRLREASK